MSKVTIALSVDLDDLEVLTDIKSKYHQKNYSQAFKTLIRQWQMLIAERQKAQLNIEKQSRKPVNPLVNP